MEKWEYASFKIETEGFSGGILDIKDFNSTLNEFGEQGWELVSCISTNMGHGATREVISVFKRKK